MTSRVWSVRHLARRWNSTEQNSHWPSPSQASQSREKRMLIARSLVRGMRPSLWAMNSSLRTEELTSISTRSMAMVGTSAIITRRSALAKLASVSRSSNFMMSSLTSRIFTLGNRWYDIPPSMLFSQWVLE